MCMLYMRGGYGMKTQILISLVLVGMLIFSTPVFASVSLPDEVPNKITQVTQRDKPAIVMINTIISGTVSWPSFTLQVTGGGSSSIVGTWQTADGTDTVIFYANGVFGGSYTGPNPVSYSGTYTIQGNTLTIIYVTPSPQTMQLTFTISGSTLILYNPQTGVSASYTKISGAVSTADDIVSVAENSMFVKDTGLDATIESGQVADGGKGTGFIISPNGYIITNAHVLFADEDPTSVVANALVNSFANALYAEFSQYYNIPDDDRNQVVAILLGKFLDYFIENGQISDVSTDYYVFSGSAAPGDDIEIDSWAATAKKVGTVTEVVGGETTWGRDVAIIKVEKTGLPTVYLGDSSKVQVGDDVFIIGYPGAAESPIFVAEEVIEPTVSTGVISAKKTLLTGIETFQTDVSMLGGNSGGPAYNSKGEVIGIATFGMTEGSGVNFLLPINLAKEFMNEINIENENSILDTKYAEALNAFWNRDCYTTIDKMNEVLALYPDHPYAQEYIDECNRAIAAGEISKPISGTPGFELILIVCAIALVLFLKRKRIN